MSARDRETQSLAEFVASRLAGEADSLTERWLAEQFKESGAHPSDAGCSRLREQIPEVVRSVASFTRLPIERARSEVIHRLRLHAERRREQGYDIQQLFTEYEALSKIVFHAFSEAVRDYPGVAGSAEVADIAGRLREGLMEITSDAVGMYRQREVEQRRELAKKLADFADAISHELKNPLGAARAGTQMLQEDNALFTSEDRDGFIELVLRNLVRMQDLIDDIRSLTLANDTESSERWVPLAVVVDKVFDAVRESAREKGVRLEVDGTLPNIAVDATRLEIGLINLVGNAVKYSDPGKQDRLVRIHADRARPTDDLPDGWEITVADNGMGIPDALHGSVFHRHFRAHPERSEGTGFGLAITKLLVTARGGKIWFESKEGAGTTFHVIIPQAEVKGGKHSVRTRP